MLLQPHKNGLKRFDYRNGSKMLLKKLEYIKSPVLEEVFSMSKANQKLLALEEVDDAFFCPAASDEGLAVGCCTEVVTVN